MIIVCGRDSKDFIRPIPEKNAVFPKDTAEHLDWI